MGTNASSKRVKICALLWVLPAVSAAGNHYELSPWVVVLYPIFLLFAFPIHSLVIVVAAVFVVRLLKKKGIIGAKAPDYNWICPQCDAVNVAQTAKCEECGKSIL